MSARLRLPTPRRAMGAASSLAALLLAPVAIAGCHSAGRYGHAVQYAPTDEEARAADKAREYDPIMVARMPDDWRGKPTTLFGVVTARAPGAAGAAYLTLGVRRLEPRNLCDNMNDDDTCRVTVSDKDFGVVHAMVKLVGEDDSGALAVGQGALLRIVGPVGEDVDATDGAPIVRATFYRHWPRTFYVTKARAADMRQ